MILLVQQKKLQELGKFINEYASSYDLGVKIFEDFFTNGDF